MENRFIHTAIGTLFALAGLFSLSGTTVAPDIRKIEPRLLHAGFVEPGTGGAHPAGAPQRVPSTVSVFLRTNVDDPALPERIGNLGGKAKRISGRGHTARLPADALRYVSNWPQVSYIEAGRRARPLLDVSRPAVFADIVQDGTGLPSGIGFTGRGTLVGIVDTGLDGTHPDFREGPSNTSRVEHVVTFSSLYPALSDTDGHGTHVAGIAAGNGRGSNGKYIGMANEAGILVGRGGESSFLTTDIVNAVSDLFAYAESPAVSKAAAVNLSLGTIEGPHDGSSAFEGDIDALAGGSTNSRRLVTVAAGNERNNGEHFQSTVSPFGSTTASLSLLPHAFQGTIVIDAWADGEDRFTITATRGSESVTAGSGSTARTYSDTIRVSNRVDAPSNGATHVQVFFAPPSGSGISASLRFDRVRNGGSGRVDAYIDFLDGSFIGSGVSPSGTVIEPGNGRNTFTVGSFRTKRSDGSSDPSRPISSTSSIGPTRDGRVKPDLAAPGEVIYSTRSFGAPTSNYSGIVPGNDNYAILSGTSMAAPHVAGIAALVWESNPGLTGAQMRERLRRTADPVDASPNPTWGYGRVNALRAVRESVASITAPASAAPGTTVLLTSGNSSGAFGKPITFSWSLLKKPDGSGATLSSSAGPSSSFLPDLPGDYVVSLVASQSDPPGTPAGSASKTIHANHLPEASFTVPAADNSGRAVTFRGSAADEDPDQPLSLHWQVVSRPAGSTASITGESVDNAVFLPDLPGTYEIGLRADDGMDNGALVVHAYTTRDAPAPAAPPHGGGGCLRIVDDPPRGSAVDSPLTSTLFLFLPATLLKIRRCKFFSRSSDLRCRHASCVIGSNHRWRNR